MPMTDILLKEHGYGPDIHYFIMHYPLYFPKNAGKAYRALHSRLQSLEMFYQQQEKRRLPSLASISLDEHNYYNDVLRNLVQSKHFAGSSTVNQPIAPKELNVSPARHAILQPGFGNRTSKMLPGLESTVVNRRRKHPQNAIDERGRVTAPIGVRETSESVKETNLLARRALYYALPGLSNYYDDDKPTMNTIVDVEANATRAKGLLRRFHVDSGLELAHAGAVNDVCLSMSERRVASAGGDCLIKLWDPRDGALIKSLRGHEKEVASVLFSKDEQFLLSGGADGLILVWNMIENNVIRCLRGHSDCIYSLAALGDLSIIYSSSHDKTIKTWHLNPQRPSAPSAPRAVGMTDTSILISWKAPPAFNEDITAFHLHYRVGLRNPWMPGSFMSAL